jgi:hypothetical protein
MSAVYEQLLTDTLYGQHTDEIRTQAGLKLCSTFSNFKNNGFQLWIIFLKIIIKCKRLKRET